MGDYYCRMVSRRSILLYVDMVWLPISVHCVVTGIFLILYMELSQFLLIAGWSASLPCIFTVIRAAECRARQWGLWL